LFISTTESVALIPAARVAAEFHVTRKTIERWVNNPSLGFPHPRIINTRWFFRRDELEEWKRGRKTLEHYTVHNETRSASPATL
jgi:hypothetical protein